MTEEAWEVERAAVAAGVALGSAASRFLPKTLAQITLTRCIVRGPGFKMSGLQGFDLESLASC